MELLEIGNVTSLAFHEPGRLAEVFADKAVTVDPDTLPAMLRAPKRKT